MKSVASSSESESRSCFVIMPVTTPESYVEKFGDREHFTHVLNHLFRPALEDVGYRVIPPSMSGSELIHAEIIKNLEKADLVLCDLSSLNPNVFFELGIRTSLNRVVAIVKDNQTPKIPFDLSAINTFNYDGSLAPWILTNEILRLIEHIKAAQAATDGGNAMWRYYGLTKRASPSEAGIDPIEAKLDLLIDEIANRQLRESEETEFRAADVYTHAETVIMRQIAAILRNGGIDDFLGNFSSDGSALVINTGGKMVPEKARKEVADWARANDLAIVFR